LEYIPEFNQNTAGLLEDLLEEGTKNSKMKLVCKGEKKREI